MAQPLHCDWTDCPNLADVLTSRLSDGDTTAWCFQHYVEVCRAVARAADDAQAEAERADDSALERLAGVEAPAPLELTEDRTRAQLEADGDAPADERLGPDASPASIADGAEAGEPFVDPVAVVPRGRSASRAAYEARQRAQAAERDAGATDEGAGPPGPSDGRVSDPAASTVEA